MSLLRVFISSTHKDLRYLRECLSDFIKDIGHIPILFENGDVTYCPGELDDSCYVEVSKADIFILIVGRRYGTAASNNKGIETERFDCIYDSITKREYDTVTQIGNAIIYVLIENDTFVDYNTFKLNSDTSNIYYPNTDSINTFRLIDSVQLNQHPILAFTDFKAVRSWLLKQWSGLFQEMIRRLYIGTEPQRKQHKRVTEYLLESNTESFRMQTFSQFIKFHNLMVIEALEALSEKSNGKFRERAIDILYKDYKSFEDRIAEENKKFLIDIEDKFCKVETITDPKLRVLYRNDLDRKIENYFSGNIQVLKCMSDFLES